MGIILICHSRTLSCRSRPILCHSRPSLVIPGPSLCHSRLDRESTAVNLREWIPACAGMTKKGCGNDKGHMGMTNGAPQSMPGGYLRGQHLVDPLSIQIHHLEYPA